jgi:hypothetical protein
MPNTSQGFYMDKSPVNAINSIIEDWKASYVVSASNMIKTALPHGLAGQSWATIMNTFAARLDMPPVSRIRANFAMLQDIYDDAGGFDRDYDAYVAYQYLFRAPISLASYLIEQRLDIDRKIPKNGQYLIVPPQDQPNTFGIRTVENVPEILEMFFETNDEQTLEVDDALYFSFPDRRLFSMKGVQRLPDDMLAYVAANKIKLR